MSRRGHAVAVVTLAWAFVPACGDRAAEGGEVPAPAEAPAAPRATEQPGPEPAPAPAAPAAEPVPAAEPPAPDAPAPAARSMRPAAREEPQQPAVDPPRAARAMEPPAAQRGAQPASTEIAPGPSAAAEPCGEKGQPSCPLQGWMERHLQQPLDDGDLAKLAQGLARVPKFVPDPAWNAGAQGWSTIAETAATAAKQGDAAAVRQSCKTCHKTWRNKYKASFRLRPIAD